MSGKKEKIKLHVMDNVSILDLINIHVLEPLPGKIEVMIESLDKNKQVVFDRKALKEFNHQLNEKYVEQASKDPRVRQHLEEFCARMIEGLYKNGLVDFEEVPNSPRDHYADMRQEWDKPKLS